MKFILGTIVGVILVPVAIVLYLLSGRAPVAASDPPMPFEKLIAKTALNATIKKGMPSAVPIQANEATFLAGAHVYRQDCAMCHGLPNQSVPIVAKGMSPRPPQLLKQDDMVTDDPPGKIFWQARNGIRLTGMPGFHASLSDDQLWQVSLLLAHADKLPASVQQELAPATTEVTPQK
jgi:mono/diheme cytochrome c family protein